MNACSLKTGTHRFFALSALIAAVVCPAPVRATELASLDRNTVQAARPYEAPLVRETYETYDVCGASTPELLAGLRRSGIRMGDGSIYDALTSWDVRWEYGHDRAPGRCSIDGFRALVDVTIRYPNWAADGTVPAELADDWDTYLHSLIRHEQGHRDIAVSAADAMTRAVAALQPAATCDDADRAVEALGRSLLQKLNRDQRAYDAKTDHGVLQGAFLP